MALVVMSYVFFGGMRGTAWVNTFQTVLFLCFGALALIVIGVGMGGFRNSAQAIQGSPLSWLLTRERISPYYFFSYTFIPLSAIAFPHILIFCLTAKKMSQFKKTVIFTTSVTLPPADSTASRMLCQTRSACFLASPIPTVRFDSSNATWPAMYTMSPHRMAWLYGSGAGAIPAGSRY